MDESVIMDALGLTEEAETTAVVAEQQAAPEGEKESPAENAEPEAEETPNESDQPMSKEERSRNAARRRDEQMKMAKSEAFEAGRRAARNEIGSTLKKVGVANPLKNGEIIETVEQFEEYAQALGGQRLANAIKNGGEDAKAALDEAIDQRLQHRDNVARAAENAAKEQSEMDNAIAQQIKSIQRYDPEIKDVKTLAAKEGAQFRDYLKKGLNFEQAYRLVHAAEIEAAIVADGGRKAAQKAAQSGKSHLSPVSQRGSGADTVPADELALYRELLPDLSDAEISRHYNADRAKFGH